MATLPQPNYYEVLGVPQKASGEQLKAAFQKLVTDFHAAGKPKNIDDVEWLRRVVHAYHALTDTMDASQARLGYDYAANEHMSHAVDNQIDRQKVAKPPRLAGSPLADTSSAHLKLK